MIEPAELRKIAKKYEADNLRFRTFLKGHANPDTLDRQFLRLHRDLFKGYDCCLCTNCCQDYNVCFDSEDILKASKYLNISEEEFIETYLKDSDDGYIIEPPCTFLEEDGKCRIQCVNLVNVQDSHIQINLKEWQVFMEL